MNPIPSWDEYLAARSRLQLARRIFAEHIATFGRCPSTEELPGCPDAADAGELNAFPTLTQHDMP